MSSSKPAWRRWWIFRPDGHVQCNLRAGGGVLATGAGVVALAVRTRAGVVLWVAAVIAVQVGSKAGASSASARARYLRRCIWLWSLEMRFRMYAAAIALTWTCFGGSTSMAQSTTQPTGQRDNAPTVEKYDVFEVTLTSGETFADPFVDAKATATFRGPGGKKVEVAGFHDGDGKWKVRFAPGEVGAWSYSAGLTGGKKAVTAKGKFRCSESKKHGFVRVSKVNPYRFQYDDGTAFYPIGIHLTSGLRRTSTVPARTASGAPWTRRPGARRSRGPSACTGCNWGWVIGRAARSLCSRGSRMDGSHTTWSWRLHWTTYTARRESTASRRS